ncbi:MAG TPA: hypothetical protein VMU49_01535 [Candidatus Acidoferrales bacterium]|nr:hypothetical protein [Candidatus Acidoferrales bacterium]
MARIGPPLIRPAQAGYFEALVRSITFQQLAGRAASAIHARFVAELPGGVDPESVLALPEERFRAAGLSGAKTASIRDLATRFQDGTVPATGLEAHSDTDLVERLSSVRGVGRWTAEMFLIFQLRRPDVWPVGDLGVRRGYGLIHGRAEPPTVAEMASLGEPYRPWRTLAAWYCWRATEVERGG